ncbi:kinase-like protein [Morchella conica CCBAS932]|uniref:non-specific serine/threonine protein kinase n=1 Tax=Morchella conica CCBAS932 TaxID=1392247 RepID=A0A3N4KM56_9PEZI|nr:kinase-like protein [Morchella conica CCBAS932]
MTPSPTTTITTIDEQQVPRDTYIPLGEDVEDVEQYGEGGYYPVDIDDEIHNRRCRIIHKFGFGCYSTVWLARDQQEDACSEILILRQLGAAAQVKNHPGHPFVLALLDEFEVQGVNGCHRCIVTEALGPSVAAVKYESEGNRLPRHISHIVATQCAKGLAYLHSCGIVHGADLDSWTVKQVCECFGDPRKYEINRIYGQSPTPATRQDAVRPPNPIKLIQYCLTDACRVRIADFGEAFLPASRCIPKDLNTPVPMAAPEVIFKDNAKMGASVEIWALACTLFEILGDHRLLESLMADRDEVLIEMVRTLGKPPDSWWRDWKGRTRYFEEDGSFKPDSGDTSGEPRTVDRKERVGEILRGENEATQEEFGEQELLALEGLLAGMLKYEPKDRIQAEQVAKELSAMFSKGSEN